MDGEAGSRQDTFTVSRNREASIRRVSRGGTDELKFEM